MSDKKVDSCLNITRRMPPGDVNDTLDNLILLTVEDDIEDKLCQSIDCPLETMTDKKTQTSFIKCDYNRDGNSWRSPKSNEYNPPFEAEDMFMPSAPLRKLEEEANIACDIYRDLYHAGGVSSVYCWDLTEESWAACWAVVNEVKRKEDLKATSPLKDHSKVKLHWSEIHVFEVKRAGLASGPNLNYQYKLTSTAIVHIDKTDKKGIEMNLSGNRTVQMEREQTVKKASANRSHVAMMGSMVEESATTLLNTMNNIFFGKMNTVLSQLHQNQKDSNKGLYDTLAKDLKKTLKTAPA